MTPLQAIRKRCLWCMNDQAYEIPLCTSKECALHPFRMGKRQPGKSPLKAIRVRCLDCVEGAKEVRECSTAICTLNPFRMGHNPNITEETREKRRRRAKAAFCEKMPIHAPFDETSGDEGAVA